MSDLGGWRSQGDVTADFELESAMRNSASWSTSIGWWGGVRMRVHVLFWVFAAFTLLISSSPLAASSSHNLTGLAALGIGILLVSALLHEWGHLLTARHFGGEGDLIVIWPLGGLEPLRPPADPRHELAMHLAGPLVNAGLCALSGIVVAVYAGTDVFGLLHPLAPRGLLDQPGSNWILAVAKLSCWINCVLWVANLLPAFPFDGGRALRSALIAARPDLSPRRVVLLVTSLAKVAAVVLVAVAIFNWSKPSHQIIPLWFSLVMLAILLYFSARQEEEQSSDLESEDQPFGYDFSQGFTSLERSHEKDEPTGPFRKWLAERREARLRQQRQQEQEEEHRVDEILGRLHEHGMESLSAEERSLLQRVSQRYRHRQERS